MPLHCFHRTCLDEHENGALDESAHWQCNKCNGRDTEICDACENEWFCDDQESSFFTGSMLQCDACTRWWHQTCHEPRISDADTKKKKWQCASCAPSGVTKARTSSKPAAAGPAVDLCGLKAPVPSKRKKTVKPSTSSPAGLRTKAARLGALYAPPKPVGYVVVEPWEADHRQPKVVLAESPPFDEIHAQHTCQICLQMRTVDQLEPYGAQVNKEYRCTVPCATKRTRR